MTLRVPGRCRIGGRSRCAILAACQSFLPITAAPLRCSLNPGMGTRIRCCISLAFTDEVLDDLIGAGLASGPETQLPRRRAVRRLKITDAGRIALER